MKKKVLSMFALAFLAMNGALFAEAEVAKAATPKVEQAKTPEELADDKWVYIADEDEIVQAEEAVEPAECGGCKKG